MVVAVAELIIQHQLPAHRVAVAEIVMVLVLLVLQGKGTLVVTAVVIQIAQVLKELVAGVGLVELHLTLVALMEGMADRQLLVLSLGLQQCIMVAVAVAVVLAELADLVGEQQLQHSKAVVEMEPLAPMGLAALEHQTPVVAVVDLLPVEILVRRILAEEAATV
jgi:hypothetical protein